MTQVVAKVSCSGSRRRVVGGGSISGKATGCNRRDGWSNIMSELHRVEEVLRSRAKG